MGDGATFFRNREHWKWAIILLSLAALAYGDKRVGRSPLSGAVQALLLAERCQTYRSVEQTTYEQMIDLKTQIKHEDDEARQKRLAAEECGKSRGIRRFKTLSDESLLAELCVEEYEAWISPGMRVRFLKEELSEMTEAWKQVRGALRWRCGVVNTSQKL